MTEEEARLWDEMAATFDAEPDHGLLDRRVRAAWADLLLPLLPAAPARVVDLDCGTGSLTVLLAEAGHEVRGLPRAGAAAPHAGRRTPARRPRCLVGPGRRRRALSILSRH